MEEAMDKSSSSITAVNNSTKKDQRSVRCLPFKTTYRSTCRSRSMNSILPHIMMKQITGKPMSQSKDFLRATVKYLRTDVKPRKLQDLVKSRRQLHKRVFLGFLKGSYWLLSYQYLLQDENTYSPFEPYVRHNPSNCLLEFWLYHPNKPLELKHVRNLFTDLENGFINFPDQLKFFVYQWIDEPSHILVFGERSFYQDDRRNDKRTLLYITYLPVPSITSIHTCAMCTKSQTSPTFSCVLHDCLLDFFGPIETYHRIEAEKNLKIPKNMYLNISDQKLFCVSISHQTLTESLAQLTSHHNRYGDCMSNVKTTVYSGHTSTKASDVIGVSDVCDDFTVNCTNNKGDYYLPYNTDNYGNGSNAPKNTCLIVRRTWLELQLLIIDEVYPIMSERTAWFNSDCILKDWTAEYIEICAETGKAVCEMSFKVGEDPRYFDPLDRHICSVTFMWDVHTGVVEITKFDEGVLVIDDKWEFDDKLMKRQAKSPTWLAKIDHKHRQPKGEKSVIELNNLPYIKGESLTQLTSWDRTAVITL